VTTRANGFLVVRFWNPDVIEAIDGVLETIRSNLSAGFIPAPSPDAQERVDLSPMGRG